MLTPIEILLISSLGLIGTAIVLLIGLWLLSGTWNVISGNLRIYSAFLFFSYALLAVGITGFFVMSPMVVTLPWLVAIFIVVADSLRHYRKAQQHALLWSMAISAEKNIPLTSAIEAFGNERAGLVNLKARRLAALLEAGVPLPEALENSQGLLPPRLLPIIRAGYESGALAKSLRQALESGDAFAPIWSSFFNRLLYIGLVIFFGLSILCFLMIKIIPSFKRIFMDFGTDLPAITRLLIKTSDTILFSPLPALLIVILIGLIIYSLICYFGWAPVYFPGLTRIMRRQDTAVILDSLAVAAQYNRPLDDVLDALAESYPQMSVRKKLKQVGKDINQGKNWCQSLHQHGLLKSVDQAVLQAAERVGNLPWALHETAESNRRRLIYRLQAWIQLMYPPLIVSLGVIVMFVIAGIFAPLIVLITRLSSP
jgi:type II secretory pathway component PulF